MRLIALQDFSWAHRGCIVEAFKKGAEIDTEDQDLIRVSLEESWAKEVDGKAAPENKEGPGPDAPDAESNPAADEIGKAEEQKATKPAENKARKAAPENK